jgi:ABC-type branched-subunit amino acid transport system substrate-binding protein
MKKIFLILVLVISSCKYNDLKLTQDFEESEQIEYIKTPKKIIKTETKIESSPHVLLQKNDGNLLNRSQEGQIILSEEENKYLKPKLGRNFESKDLSISSSSGRKIRIALLLPLTGKNKDLGWSIYNSASLSLFDNDSANKIELVLFDSKDSPEDNKKAFKEIIDSNIKVVIGPVFSNNAMSIEKMARDNEITVI